MNHQAFMQNYDQGEPVLFYAILQGFYEVPDFSLARRMDSLWSRLTELEFTVDAKPTENKVSAQLGDKTLHFETYSCVLQLSFSKHAPDLEEFDKHWTGLRSLLPKNYNFESAGTRVTYVLKSAQPKVQNLDRRLLLNPTWFEAFASKEDLMTKFELNLTQEGDHRIETDIQLSLGGVKYDDELASEIGAPIRMTYNLPGSVVIDLKRRYRNKQPSSDLVLKTDAMAKQHLLSLFEGQGWV